MAEPFEIKLRWRFDYHGNRASKIGAWNDSTQEDSDERPSAWRQSKAGLASAAIEGLFPDGSVKRIAECKGSDYRNFEWIVGAIQDLGLREPFVVGLSLITKDTIGEVYINGAVQARNADFDAQDYEGLK